MSRFSKRIHNDAQAYLKALVWEYKFIFRDKAVMLSFIGVSILVSFLYSYIYSNETLTKLPVAVVDMDNTTISRQLLRMFDGSEQIQIQGYYTDLPQAQRVFNQDQARGIIVIPRHFSREVQRNSSPAVSVYADASYMLYYKQILTSVKTAIGYMNAGVQMKKYSAQGQLPQQAKDNSMAVTAKTVSMYNLSSGYATFLIPIVLVIIFQTTLLTAIGILGGSLREEAKMSRMYPHANNFLGTLPIVMGKATTYLLMSLIILFLMTGFVMPFFNIPVRAQFVDIVVFMIPFLLSVVYLGIFLTSYFGHREDAILFIMFTSIPAMLLTGFSWPMGAMPQWLQIFSYLVPSTLGTKGFVRLTQMGADFSLLHQPWIMMWILCIFYLILAVLSTKRIYLKEKQGFKQLHNLIS